MPLSTPISEILNRPDIQGSILHQTPKPYQIEDTKLLLDWHLCNDFSDAGTGKTLKSFMYLAAKVSEGKRVIVAMPPTLIKQYTEEFKRLVSDLSFTAVTIKQSKQLTGKETGPEIRRAAIVFLSIEMFAKIYSSLLSGSAKGTHALIVDECHSVKNSETANWHAVNEAIQVYGCSYLGMSATPMTGELIDAYAHIALKDPSAYKNFKAFQRKHVEYKVIPISRFKSWKKIVGYEDIAELTERLNFSSVRRRVDDVLSLDQPNVMEHCVYLSEKHQQLYDTLLDERLLALPDDSIQVADNESAVRAYAMQLISVPEVYAEGRNIDDQPLSTLFGILDSLLPSKKVVIFSQYRACVDKLHKLIEKRYKTRAAKLYGGTNESDKFKTDKEYTCLVANFKSGYSGHNFQISHNIIMYEPDGTPAVVNQAIARCRREGQKHPVNVWLFRYVDTYSEKLIDSCLGRDQSVMEVMRDKTSLISLLRPSK
jgi:SNF2 family DNA or RNA helicase